MVYNISVTDTVIASFKEKLTTALCITSILYENSSYFIFTTPYSNKVVKIQASTYGIGIYTGDSWTSTYNIVNPMKVMGGDANVYALELKLIVTSTVMAFVQRGYAYSQTLIFGKLQTSGEFVCYGFSSSSSSSYTGISLNLSTNTRIIPLTYQYDINIVNNGFVTSDLIYINVDLTINNSPFIGAKSVYVSRNTDSVIRINGNDTIVNGGYTNNGTVYMIDFCILIIDGNI